MEKVTLKIDGMHCDNCAKRLEKALLTKENIKTAKVDFASQTAIITYDNLSLNKVKEYISDIGFSATAK